jgi:hypothetical protein
MRACETEFVCVGGRRAVAAAGALVRRIISRRLGFHIRGQPVDALEPGELIALLQTDEAHALGVASDH